MPYYTVCQLPDHQSPLQRLLDSSAKPTAKIEARFGLLQILNHAVERVIPFIDMNTIDDTSTFAGALAACRGILFQALKSALWEGAITATKGGGSLSIAFNRPKAANFAARGTGPDVTAEYSCFGQLYQQMLPKRSSHFRHHGRMFSTTFVGEGAQDAGGPYREAISTICRELQSSALHLFVPCANAVAAVRRGVHTIPVALAPSMRVCIHASSIYR